MTKNKKYQIKDFYVGELYLATSFGNLLVNPSIAEGEANIKRFTSTGAINFQRGLINKYIDWETRKEYTGFLTIFYKQGDNLICLHDGKTYQLDGDSIIDNLVPLNELLPKIDNRNISGITMTQALELFNILFKESNLEEQLYIPNDRPITDFYVGDVSLKERTPVSSLEQRVKYIDLPHHIMLGKSSTAIYSYGKDDYISTVYRCLFLRDGVDLYNIHNHQFYNPNEDSFDTITNFKDYIQTFEEKPQRDSLTIPKALRLFKKTL